MARDRPVLERESSNHGTTTDGTIHRRSYLRIVGGAAATAGIAAGAGAIPVSAGSDDPEVIELDYDEYDQPSDVYRVWTGDPSLYSFSSSDYGVASGTQSLEKRLPQGNVGGANAHYWFTEEGHGAPKELYQRFRFRASPNFTMSDQDTLRFFRAGLDTRYGNRHSGVNGAPRGDDGWSATLYASVGRYGTSGGTSRVDFGIYSYHMDQPSASGESIVQHHDVANGLDLTEWHEFEVYTRMNTVSGGSANRDGVVRVWIDGELAFEKTDYRWTTTDAQGIELAGPGGVRYGGGGRPSDDFAFYFDDHTMIIGGMPEDVGERPSTPVDDEDDEDDPDPLEAYDERLTYRDPERESDYRIYVDGEIIQHDWSQATLNDTVEITEEGDYQVVTATSPAENVDGYVFDGEVVAIASEYEPMMWISGERIDADDYPDVPEDLEDEDEEETEPPETDDPDDDSSGDDRDGMTPREYLEWLRERYGF